MISTIWRCRRPPLVTILRFCCLQPALGYLGLQAKFLSSQYLTASRHIYGAGSVIFRSSGSRQGSTLRVGVAIMSTCAGAEESSTTVPEGPSVPPDVAAALKELYKDRAGEGDKRLSICVVTTGAGGHLAAWMLGTPGASSVLSELITPYSFGATKDLLDITTKASTKATNVSGGYCSAATACHLAKAAYRRAIALALREQDGPTLLPLTEIRYMGLACTASVATTVPKKGAHRAHICTYADNGTSVGQYTLTLTKGARNRMGEDYAVSKAALAALLQGSDPRQDCPPYWLDHMRLDAGPQRHTGSEDRVVTEHDVPPGVSADEAAEDPIDALAKEAADMVLYVAPAEGDGPVSVHTDVRFPYPVIVYPGSFNPLHEGHMKLAAAAQVRVQGLADWPYGDMLPPVVHEISTTNADKGQTEREVLRSRLVQFASEGRAIALTRTPLFVDKAKLFPGAYFLIGADTVKRLLDPKYYGNSAANKQLAMSQVLHLGCRFVVGGRWTGSDEKFITLEDVLQGVELPSAIRDLFIGLTEDQFRLDISSTEIRARVVAAGGERIP